MALGMTLKHFIIVSKGLKPKVIKSCGLIPMFVEVTGTKTSEGEGAFRIALKKPFRTFEFYLKRFQ